MWDQREHRNQSDRKLLHFLRSSNESEDNLICSSSAKANSLPFRHPVECLNIVNEWIVWKQFWFWLIVSETIETFLSSIQNSRCTSNNIFSNFRKPKSLPDYQHTAYDETANLCSFTHFFYRARIILKHTKHFEGWTKRCLLCVCM